MAHGSQVEITPLQSNEHEAQGPATLSVIIKIHTGHSVGADIDEDFVTCVWGTDVGTDSKWLERLWYWKQNQYIKLTKRGRRETESFTEIDGNNLKIFIAMLSIQLVVAMVTYSFSAEPSPEYIRSIKLRPLSNTLRNFLE